MSRRRFALCAGALVAFVFVTTSLAGLHSARRSTRSTGTTQSHSTIIRDEPSAMPGKRLDIDLATGGGIHIRGQDSNQVSVEYAKAEEDCPDAQVDVRQTDAGVSVTSRYLIERHVRQCSMEIMILVPKRYDIQIRSAGGAIEISDVDGAITGHTGGGELYLSRLRGELELRTGGGEIHVLDSHLEGSVRTGGGAAVLQNVSGGLEASSGSGPVIRRGKGKSI